MESENNNLFDNNKNSMDPNNKSKKNGLVIDIDENANIAEQDDQA